MKVRKNLKKGFTLVELVVVIAVIAILAAVSVVTYTSITKKAKQAVDNELVAEVNRALITGDKPKNMTEALEKVELYGFEPEKFRTRDDSSKYAYSLSKNQFVILDKDGNVSYPSDFGAADNLDLWLFADSKEEIESGTYSYYLRNNDVSGKISVKGGFDSGRNDKISEVEYDRSAQSGAQTVIIRTNNEFTSMLVNAPSDTVYHYGKAGLIDIISVDSNSSYHEHGEVALAKIANGRIVVTGDSEIGGIHAVATDDEFNNIKIAVVGNSEIPTITRDSVSEDAKTAEGTYTKFVLEIQTIPSENTQEDNAEYLWISVVVEGGEATVSTEVATSKATLNDSTKIPETSQSSAAKTISETTADATTAEEAENAFVPMSITSFAQLKAFVESDTKVNGIIGADFDITGQIAFDRKIVLDLNGHKLSNVTTGSRPFNINAHADVVINGNTKGSEISMPVSNTASYGLFFLNQDCFTLNDYAEGIYGPSLVLNGGTYSGTTNSGGLIKYKTFVSNIEMYGVTVVTAGGGILAGDGSLASSYTDNENVKHKMSYNYATIKDCDFTQGLADNGVIYNVGLSLAGVYISNGLIENTTITSAHGVAIYCANGDSEIKNCNVTVLEANTTADWLGAAIGVATDARVTVNGGNYKGQQYGLDVYTSNGHVTINNAIFSGDTALNVRKAVNTGYRIADGYAMPNITVNSGTFSGNLGQQTDSKLELKGGSYSVDPSNYVDTEHYNVAQQNDMWLVTAK